MGIDIGLFIGRNFVEIGWIGDGCPITRRAARYGPVFDCVLALIADAELCLTSINSIAIGTSLADDYLAEEKVSRTALIESVRSSTQAHDLDHSRDKVVIPNELLLRVDEPLDYDGCAGALSTSEIERAASGLDQLDIDSVAICLPSAEGYHGNEVTLAKAIQRRHPCLPVFLSCLSEVSRAPIRRLEALCGDALLSPVISEVFDPLHREMSRLGLPEPVVLDGRGSGVTLDECVRRPGILRGSEFACLSFASSTMGLNAGDNAILALAWLSSASQAWSVSGSGMYMAPRLVANTGSRLRITRTQQGVVIRDERDWGLKSAALLSCDEGLQDLATRIEGELGRGRSCYDAMATNQFVDYEIARDVAGRFNIATIATFPSNTACLGLLYRAASSLDRSLTSAGSDLPALELAWRPVDQRS